MYEGTMYDVRFMYDLKMYDVRCTIYEQKIIDNNEKNFISSAADCSSRSKRRD
jgi:hypothetical protein